MGSCLDGNISVSANEYITGDVRWTERCKAPGAYCQKASLDRGLGLLQDLERFGGNQLALDFCMQMTSGDA